MYACFIAYVIIFVTAIVLSFGKRIRFVKQWRYLFPAILLTGCVFTLWDYFFTLWGIWNYNDNKIIGVKLLNIPLEKFLFFLCIPFAGILIYEFIKEYLNKNYLQPFSRAFGWVLILAMGWMVFSHPERLYTSVSALLACVLIAWSHLYFNKPWLTRFWATSVCCLPLFLLMNIFLISLPVISYTNEFILGIGLFSVPVENLVYEFDLLLMVIILYEKQRFYLKKPEPVQEVTSA